MERFKVRVGGRKIHDGKRAIERGLETQVLLFDDLVRPPPSRVPRRGKVFPQGLGDTDHQGGRRRTRPRGMRKHNLLCDTCSSRHQPVRHDQSVIRRSGISQTGTALGRGSRRLRVSGPYDSPNLLFTLVNSNLVECFITHELVRWPSIEGIYGPTLRHTPVFVYAHRKMGPASLCRYDSDVHGSTRLKSR